MLLRFAMIFVMVGVALSCSKPRVTRENAPPPSPVAISTPTIPDGWRRIEVTSKFAFYMPAEMRMARERTVFASPTGAFDNGHMYLTWAYRATDSCKPNGVSQPPGYTRTDTTAAGKRAVLQTWGPDEAGLSGMTICFLDIGDGKTQLTLGAMSKDHRDFDVARQVFASIQFLQGAT